MQELQGCEAAEMQEALRLVRAPAALGAADAAAAVALASAAIAAAAVAIASAAVALAPTTVLATLTAVHVHQHGELSAGGRGALCPDSDRPQY